MSTRNPDQIKDWWQATPGAAVAIKTAGYFEEGSGLFVLSFGGPDAERKLGALEKRWGRLPETLTARSKDGIDLYFQAPKMPFHVHTRPIRSEEGGKYYLYGAFWGVVAPPGLPEDRKIWANDLDPAEPPEWLAELLETWAPPMAAASAKASALALQRTKATKKPGQVVINARRFFLGPADAPHRRR